MNNIEKEAYEKAISVLQKCATLHGFFAAFPGYDMVWSRDSIITSLGASLIENKFKNTFKQSIITLSDNQSKKGQIPNAVDKFSNRKHHVDFQTLDSSLWYIIGNYVYKERFDSELFNKNKSKIEKALFWISQLDTGEDGMPEQLPTTDWQDAFPHRYGHTINTQALYYKCLMLLGKNKEAHYVKKQVNTASDVSLWSGDFYLPWRWKNHNKYQERGAWFDSLGNLLAIIFELADNNQANKILNHIEKNNINKPYPIKAIYPPILKGSKDWQDYFNDAESKTPYHYLNGGIWTYIGGFYILALIKQKQFEKAEIELKKLAEANLNSNFAEWLDGKTGKAGLSQAKSQEDNQAWNAGMYILAYESLKKKKVLLP